MAYYHPNAKKRPSKKSSRSYKPKGRPSRAKGVRTAKSKSGRTWHKTASGEWVISGGKAKAAPVRGGKRKASKKGKPWPKKGSKSMGKAVAGVEARVHEDLIKAQKLVQSARYRIHHTGKAAGGRSGTVEKVFSAIVKGIEQLITRV